MVNRKAFCFSLINVLGRPRRIGKSTAQQVAIVLVTAFLAFTCPQAVRATVLTGQMNGGVLSKLSPNGKFKTALSVTPVERIADPSVDDLNLLRKLYTNWRFFDGNDATGKFNVLQYDAFGLTAVGGAEFTVLYDDQAVTPRTDYSWIQIAYPKNWGKFDSTVFNDAKFSNFPFYDSYIPLVLDNVGTLPNGVTPTNFEGSSIWRDKTSYPQQKIQNPAGDGKPPNQSKLPAGDLLFEDEPFCTYTCVMGDDTSSLLFDLFLVSFTWNGLDGSDAAGAVTIHDGLRWGVEIYRVPEPSTFNLFTLGLLLFLLIRAFSRSQIVVIRGAKQGKAAPDGARWRLRLTGVKV